MQWMIYLYTWWSSLKLNFSTCFFLSQQEYCSHTTLMLQVHSRERGSARGSVQATASQVQATSYSTRAHCTSIEGLEDLITGRWNPLAIGAGCSYLWAVLIREKTYARRPTLIDRRLARFSWGREKCFVLWWKLLGKRRFSDSDFTTKASLVTYSNVPRSGERISAPTSVQKRHFRGWRCRVCV